MNKFKNGRHKINYKYIYFIKQLTACLSIQIDHESCGPNKETFHFNVKAFLVQRPVIFIQRIETKLNLV